MESTAALDALAALSHAARLDAFRALVRAGHDGLPAGDLALRLGVPANTLSTNLGILSRAGLVMSRRDGRSVIYSADYAGMSALIGFLMKDCCEGRAEVCAPVAKAALSLQTT